MTTPVRVHDALTQVAIERLIPYARNARTHSEQQVAQIAGSIREFGFTNPVLIDDDFGIVAGHGRVLAAKRLGMDRLPCITLSCLTAAQRRAYVLADNKLAMNAGWDEELLRLEIGELQDLGVDLNIAGFSDDDLAALTAPPATDGLTDPDETPEAPVEPISATGDVWILGGHRLVCGDSTTVESVDLALNGVKPHLMVTDPPYGVSYDADWRNRARRADGSPIGGRAVGAVENDDRADWSEAWALFPGDVAYIWHAGNLAHVVAESLLRCDLQIRAQIIWAKNQFVIGRGDYHTQHEPCWYAVRKGRVGHYDGGRGQSTLWQIDKPRKSETGHSTQKPVECMKRPIENNSSPGQAVYEPFSGSRTTIIAAEMTGRACHAIELNPQYVDIAVVRWQNFTGKSATLDGDGRTFSEIAIERGKVAA